MYIRPMIMCLAVAASAPCAFGQGEPTLPHTGADFVAMASQDGMTEVQLGKMALMKSSNPDIKKFASRMVRDHSKANTQLAGIAKKDGIPVSKSLDAEHSAMLQKMSEKSGADFDAAYTSDMLADHKKAITLFENEQSDTAHPALSSFAQSTLPVLREHQHMAQQLTSKVAQQMPNGAAKSL
jgi:putative membrane protein